MSPKLLVAIGVALNAYWIYMAYVVLKLPAPSRGYPVLFLGLAVMFGLGWYNADREGSKAGLIVGLTLLYMALGVGVLGILCLGTLFRLIRLSVIERARITYAKE